MRTFAAYLSAGVTFLSLAVGASSPADQSGSAAGYAPGEAEGGEIASGTARSAYSEPAVPAPDTLRDTVRVGTVYLRSLPARRSGRTIRSYEAVRPPALSWIVDRSLLWNTAGTNPGRRRLLLLARSDAAVDTLIVDLTILPR